MDQSKSTFLGKVHLIRSGRPDAKPLSPPVAEFYAELHPVDLIALVREGDAGAVRYLDALSQRVMRAKVRAGAKSWRPRLLKWADSYVARHDLP